MGAFVAPLRVILRGNYISKGQFGPLPSCISDAVLKNVHYSTSVNKKGTYVSRYVSRRKAYI